MAKKPPFPAKQPSKGGKKKPAPAPMPMRPY